MIGEQVVLMASFETAHREESTRQFMAVEREALAAMLVMCANTVREAAHVAAEEEAARMAARAAEATMELAAREEAACEVHELAPQRRHRLNLDRRQAHHACQADGEGSNTVDLGWGDNLL
jgi:hypothetical protein